MVKKIVFVLIIIIIIGIGFALFVDFLVNKHKEEQRKKIIAKSVQKIEILLKQDSDDITAESLTALKQEIEIAKGLGCDVSEYKKYIPEQEALFLSQGFFYLLPDEVEKAKKIVAEVETMNVEWSKRNEYYYLRMKNRLSFLEAFVAIHELWNPILRDTSEVPSKERLKEILSVLEKYQGSPISNTAIGTTSDLIEKMIRKYPTLAEELKRIYHR